ncbi:hypothetical protein PWT90_05286 [Aphanocladium album]|nr:hypothetical protein PWT90_05286 [Aphanocladium album]
MTTFQYPGYDLDLRHVDGAQYPVGFPEAQGGKSEILQLREVAMMMLMDQITDKPNWHEKVFDEEIVAKWRKEAAEHPEESLYKRIIDGKEYYDMMDESDRHMNKRLVQPSKIITTKAFEFCIQELRNKAKYFRDTGIVPTLDSSNYSVVKSDTLFSDQLRAELSKAFDSLRVDQADNVDWHPNSNDMVQDLVHPSMYPFIYGKTPFMNEEQVGLQRAIELVGQGKPISSPKTDGERNQSCFVSPQYWSEIFQWLPSNVSFQDDKTVKISSYVNNLHPVKYQGIYQTIEKAIQTAIPLWDQCLKEHRCYHTYDKVDGVESKGRGQSRFEVIEKADDSDESLWSDFDLKYYLTADIPISNDDEKELERGHFPFTYIFFETVESLEERKTGKPYVAERSRRELARDPKALVPEKLAYYKWMAAREAILPEPLPFAEVDYASKKSISDIYAKDGLQIIVKMASIELTPEKPEFPAGGWHLEGMMNEKIVATALFYIDSQNITDSHIAFRAQTSEYLSDDIQTGQDAYNWLERVHGTCLARSFSECWQPYGDVKTPQGRILAFPNTLQHRVSPFTLQDPTKPGHRRFLALWLVDPHVRVISTANVPPQQKDWWTAEHSNGAGAAAAPPAGLMTRDEACEQRLKLMEERGLGQRELEDHWSNVEYSFCEH